MYGQIARARDHIKAAREILQRVATNPDWHYGHLAEALRFLLEADREAYEAREDALVVWGSRS